MNRQLSMFGYVWASVSPNMSKLKQFFRVTMVGPSVPYKFPLSQAPTLKL